MSLSLGVHLQNGFQAPPPPVFSPLYGYLCYSRVGVCNTQNMTEGCLYLSCLHFHAHYLLGKPAAMLAGAQGSCAEATQQGTEVSAQQTARKQCFLVTAM
jgi:hypothetical protein